MICRSRVLLALVVLCLLTCSVQAQRRESSSAQVDAIAPITVETLKQVEAKVVQVVDRALRCTVCVQAADGRGSGSGVVVSEEGLVLTAAHVMLAAGRDIRVIFPDGREVPAKPLGANRNRDAGMLQIQAKGKYPHVDLGESGSLQTNQWCVALGHAGGFDQRRSPPVRLGRVLSNDNYVTTDSAIISGDSGGPLFDLSGKLIGIHSNIGASLSMNNHVPADVYRANWDRLVRGETWGRLPGSGGNPKRPVIGIQFSDDPRDGAKIIGVSPGGPADKAGVRAGDIVQQVNGQQVNSARDVVLRVGSLDVGDRVTLGLLREGRAIQLTARLVPLGQLPEDPGADSDSEGESDADDPASADGGSENDDQSNQSKLDLADLMRRARENGGRLELTPEQYRRLQQAMPGQFSAKRRSLLFSDEIRSWGQRVFAAYGNVVAASRPSILPVIVRGRQVALATAVSEHELLTKASEIARQDFQLQRADGTLVEGELIKAYGEYDLALVRVADTLLKPVRWADSKPLRLGQFVAVASNAPEPEAIGVVSVMPRGLDVFSQGFLGVAPQAHADGVKLVNVVDQSPASRANLQVGDIVLSLDGQKYTSPAAFAQAISRHDPGKQITLRIRRGDAELKLSVKLEDRRGLPSMSGSLGIMNQLGGPLSKRRDQFKQVIQHDSPLDPEDCGGPLVNLDGEVIAINVARAGRIKSYAVPEATIQQLLK